MGKISGFEPVPSLPPEESWTHTPAVIAEAIAGDFFALADGPGGIEEYPVILRDSPIYVGLPGQDPSALGQETLDLLRKNFRGSGRVETSEDEDGQRLTRAYYYFDNVFPDGSRKRFYVTETDNPLITDAVPQSALVTSKKPAEMKRAEELHLGAATARLGRHYRPR